MQRVTNEQIEAEILAENGVKKLAENSYTVAGSRGDLYTVRFVGRTDDGDGRVWECNCPGYQHRGNCKHLTRVVAAVNEICDVCGYD